MFVRAVACVKADRGGVAAALLRGRSDLKAGSADASQRMQMQEQRQANSSNHALRDNEHDRSLDVRVVPLLPRDIAPSRFV